MRILHFLTSAFFTVICICLTGCENDIDEISTINNTDEIVEGVPFPEDAPIKTLFSTSRDVGMATNGECVIGVIQYCGKKFGMDIPRDVIIEYFGDKVIKDSNGRIYGIMLDSSDWDKALNNWFTATYPAGQNDVIAKVRDGELVCCRISTDPVYTHAVVLTGLVPNKYQFKYYDPVLGGTENTISFFNVYDPRIITPKVYH